MTLTTFIVTRIVGSVHTLRAARSTVTLAPLIAAKVTVATPVATISTVTSHLLIKKSRFYIFCCCWFAVVAAAAEES